MRDLEALHVLGVDPGGQSTGIVERVRDDVTAHTVVERGTDDLKAYVSRVLDELDALTSDATRRLLAVEGLNAPSPHMGMTSVRGLIDTATVLGAVLGWAWTAPDVWDRTVVVDPGGHGSAPLRSYPAVLVGARETKGAGRLRHARSAYDVAGAGRVRVRIARGTPVSASRHG